MATCGRVSGWSDLTRPRSKGEAAQSRLGGQQGGGGERRPRRVSPGAVTLLHLPQDSAAGGRRRPRCVGGGRPGVQQAVGASGGTLGHLPCLGPGPPIQGLRTKSSGCIQNWFFQLLTLQLLTTHTPRWDSSGETGGQDSGDSGAASPAAHSRLGPWPASGHTSGWQPLPRAQLPRGAPPPQEYAPWPRGAWARGDRGLAAGSGGWLQLGCPFCR